MMDKEDTKFAIGEALVSLMKEKPYQKIEAMEIAKAAFVSRPTFYRYYEGTNPKISILLYYLEHEFKNYKTDWAKKRSVSFKATLLYFLSFVEAHADIFTKVDDSTLSTLLFTLAKNHYLTPNIRFKDDSAYRFYIEHGLYVYAICAFQWVKEGMHTSKADLIKHFFISAMGFFNAVSD